MKDLMNDVILPATFFTGWIAMAGCGVTGNVRLGVLGVAMTLVPLLIYLLGRSCLDANDGK